MTTDDEESSERQPHEDSGKFGHKVPDQAFIDAVAEQSHPCGTKEIADEVGVTRRTAHRRLSALEEQGAVTSIQIGRALAWTLDD